MSRRRPFLVEIAGRLPDRLVLADVGVRYGFEPRWTALGPAARLIGFDADEEECRVLQTRYAHLPAVTFAPVALGDRAGSQTLHITREPAASSLLEPDVEVLRRRRGLKAMRPVRTVPVETETLAGWAERSGLERVDVVKLDVQGAELAVLRGAGGLLDRVRALDLEVEFNPIYRGQPLFGEIDAFLRERGFVLWRLGELTHCGLPESTGGSRDIDTVRFADGRLRYRVGGGQLTWGRARYVRRDMVDPTRPRTWEAEVRDACAAWSLQVDDVARAALSRAATLDPGARRALAELPRTRRPRALPRRDLPGAARRWLRVHALALRGWEDERIAREAGLTPGNVRLLRRRGPGRAGRPGGGRST
jgi:FkbM family methyltransferase